MNGINVYFYDKYKHFFWYLACINFKNIDTIVNAFL